MVNSACYHCYCVPIEMLLDWSVCQPPPQPSPLTRAARVLRATPAMPCTLMWRVQLQREPGVTSPTCDVSVAANRAPGGG